MRKTFMLLLIIPLAALAQIQRTPYGLIASHAGQPWLFVAIEDTNNASPQTVTITTKAEPKVFKNGAEWRITFPAATASSGSPLYDSLVAQREALEKRIAKNDETSDSIMKASNLRRIAGQDTNPDFDAIRKLSGELIDLRKQQAVIDLKIQEVKRYLPAK